MKLKTLWEILAWWKKTESNVAFRNMKKGAKKIRLEAIKWVKYYDEEKKQVSQSIKDHMGFIQGWIMDFFNLTSEDLK